MTIVELEGTLALLERTPAAFAALLRGLPDVWTRRNEGNATWTVRDVVAHLIHGERVNWLPRLRFMLASGEADVLPPFDREGFAIGGPQALEALLEEFAEVRAGNLHDVRELHLEVRHLKLCGRHPALGTVTVGQLMATWATHDLTHLHQVSRVMAYQSRHAVGPWKQYLGVLHCAAHGA